MFSRKYQIDSVTSLIERVQIKRQEKLEKELLEYWKPINEYLRSIGLWNGDVVLTLGVSAGLLSFFSQELTMLVGATCMSYMLISYIASVSYNVNKPRLPVIMISK